MDSGLPPSAAPEYVGLANAPPPVCRGARAASDLSSPAPNV